MIRHLLAVILSVRFQIFDLFPGLNSSGKYLQDDNEDIENQTNTSPQLLKWRLTSQTAHSKHEEKGMEAHVAQEGVLQRYVGSRWERFLFVWGLALESFVNCFILHFFERWRGHQD